MPRGVKKKSFSKNLKITSENISVVKILSKNWRPATLLKNNSARDLSTQIRSSATLRVENSIIRICSNTTDNLIEGLLVCSVLKSLGQKKKSLEKYQH